MPPTTVGGRLAANRFMALHLSTNNSDNNASTSRKRKRVKRKEPIATAPESSTSQAPIPDLKPRDDAPVELQIKDVREIVSGKALSSPQESSTSNVESSGSVANLGGTNVGGGGSDDSLERLLADAKEMRKDMGESASSDEDGSTSIKETIRNVLSTIVTVDFFVVCALLLWFLTGIFCSYILKNDAVQIAFNGIFEQIVQPALGVLMLGSAASGKLRYSRVMVMNRVFHNRLMLTTSLCLRQYTQLYSRKKDKNNSSIYSYHC